MSQEQTELINKVMDLKIPIVIIPNGTSDTRLYQEPGQVAHERYMLTFREDIEPHEKTKKLDKIQGFRSRHVFDRVGKGCSVTMNKGLLRQMMDDPEILFMEKDILVSNLEYTSVPRERVPEEELITKQVYWHQTDTNTIQKPTDDFSSVNCYILDSGILRGHTEFNTGQVTLAYNALDRTTNATDNNGHGTAVASVIGGKTVGVANKTRLHAIKVLNSTGSGYTSDIVAGLNWVVANKRSPCVVNMSLGGSLSSTLNTAVQNCINTGVHVVCAAGNSGVDASTISPANVLGAVTVSAHDSGKTRPTWGNYGAVLDTFAPGVSVTAAWGDSTDSYYRVNGTSFSAPIIAGLVCRILQQKQTATPREITEALSRMNKVGEIVNPGSTTTPNLRVVWDPNRITPC
jgi:subtilisin family serine protease